MLVSVNQIDKTPCPFSASFLMDKEIIVPCIFSYYITYIVQSFVCDSLVEWQGPENINLSSFYHGIAWHCAIREATEHTLRFGPSTCHLIFSTPFIIWYIMYPDFFPSDL
jgi:hypothetical protein